MTATLAFVGGDDLGFIGDLGRCAVNPVDCTADLIGGAVSSTASAGMGAVFSAINSWIGVGAAQLVTGMFELASSSSTADIDARWFVSGQVAQVRVLGAAVFIGAFIFGVVAAMVNTRDTDTWAKVILRSGVGALGAAAVIPVTTTLLTMVDLWTQDIISRTSGDFATMADGLLAISGANGLFMVTALMLLMAVSAVLLWLVLVVRTAFVFILIAVSPLVFAMAPTQSGLGMIRRWMRFMIVAVMAKAIIVLVLSIGVGAIAALGDGNAENALATAVGGAGLFLTAAISPVTLLAMMPEDQVASQMGAGGVKKAGRTAGGAAAISRMSR